jgi:hypothetical protein
MRRAPSTLEVTFEGVCVGGGEVVEFDSLEASIPIVNSRNKIINYCKERTK